MANTMPPTIRLASSAPPSRRIGRSLVSGSPASNAEMIRRVTNRYARTCSRRVCMPPHLCTDRVPPPPRRRLYDRGRRCAVGAVVGPWTAAAGLAAVVALGAVFLRARGGWWYEERGPRGRWRRRGSERTPARVPGLAVLGPLAPGLTILSVEDRGTRIGVGQDADGWFAVLALDTQPDLADERSADLSLDRLVRLLPDATAVSVVSQLTLAQTAELDPRAPAVQSYQELLGSAPVAE